MLDLFRVGVKQMNQKGSDTSFAPLQKGTQWLNPSGSYMRERTLKRDISSGPSILRTAFQSGVNLYLSLYFFFDLSSRNPFGDLEILRGRKVHHLEQVL